MPKQRAIPTNIAYINSTNLTWAIERSGLTREAIAAELKTSVDVLALWEQTGGERPTFDQAARLSEYLGVPLGLLFLSKPPQRKLAITDRRSLGAPRQPSANLQRLLSDVLIRRDWYRQYALENGGKPLTFVGSASGERDVVAIANDIRSVLRLKPEDRRSVYTWNEYMTRLSYKAEDAGLLVMRSGVVGNTQRRVDRDEVQGFALADPIAPVVFVNSSDFVSAQIFTLAHELAHIWIGESAISNPEEGDSDRDAIETRCNSIATEFLVPKRDFVVGWRQTIESDRMRVLKRRYWVSGRVILRRARELGEISFDQYHSLRDMALAAEKPKKKGGPTYYDGASTRAGYRLTDAVLSEVNRGRLLIPEGATLLSMAINTFANFAEQGQ